MAVITVLDVRLQRRCFTVKFGKYLGTPFFTEQFQWLLQMLGFLGDFNNVMFVMFLLRDIQNIKQVLVIKIYFLETVGKCNG